jgi:hypothetical protein
MRTKTLLLSAALGALSSASLMAQVYSLNAVGYINVTCPPGFSTVANQLNNGTNFIDILNAQILANPNAFLGDEVFKLSAPNGSYTIWQVGSRGISSGIPLTPVNGAAAAVVTFNPGEAIFFNNVQTTNITLTFVGTVLTGSPTNTPANGLTNLLSPGFNFVSSMVPVAGSVGGTSSVLGITPTVGDEVFVYDLTSSAYDIFNYTGVTARNPSGWGIVTAASGVTAPPTVAVGQPFYYDNTATTTNSWVESFSVSQ